MPSRAIPPVRGSWQGETSFVVEEDSDMMRARREMEQNGHRQFGVKVHVRPHEIPVQGEQEQLQAEIENHPALETQRFSGQSKQYSPLISLNPEARTKLENEASEQEKAKQLRLGNELNYRYDPRMRPSM